jgi:hypothetical protein
MYLLRHVFILAILLALTLSSFAQERHAKQSTQSATKDVDPLALMSARSDTAA